MSLFPLTFFLVRCLDAETVFSFYPAVYKTLILQLARADESKSNRVFASTEVGKLL